MKPAPRVHINNASVPAPYIKLEKELKKIISKKQQAVANQNFEMAASCRDAQTKIEKEIEDMKRNGSRERLANMLR